MQRRSFLITPPALALGAAASLATAPTLAAPAIISPQSVILPRQGKGPRIVICGGGWGGLTAARYLRELVDIGVLQEQRMGKEKLFLHPAYLRLLSDNTHAPQRYALPQQDFSNA